MYNKVVLHVIVAIGRLLYNVYGLTLLGRNPNALFFYEYKLHLELFVFIQALDRFTRAIFSRRCSDLPTKKPFETRMFV